MKDYKFIGVIAMMVSTWWAVICGIHFNWNNFPQTRFEFYCCIVTFALTAAGFFLIRAGKRIDKGNPKDNLGEDFNGFM